VLASLLEQAADAQVGGRSRGCGGLADEPLQVRVGELAGVCREGPGARPLRVAAGDEVLHHQKEDSPQQEYLQVGPYKNRVVHSRRLVCQGPRSATSQMWTNDPPLSNLAIGKRSQELKCRKPRPFSGPLMLIQGISHAHGLEHAGGAEVSGEVGLEE